MSLQRKLGAYSIAAGAAAIGIGTTAQAALQVYDHRAAPLTPAVELWNPGTPDDLIVLRMDGTYKYKLKVGGGVYEYYDQSGLTTPITGADKSGDAVWFMYEWYPDEVGDGKDGVVMHTEPTNGVAGFLDGAANHPYLLGGGDSVDASLDFYTDGTGVSIFGHGSGGNGYFDGYGYGENYLGFFMDEPDGRHYGWVQLNQPWERTTTSVLGWAYEDAPNTAAVTPLYGDFNGDMVVNELDIDLLAEAIRTGSVDLATFDISANGTSGEIDGVIDMNDLDYLVRSLVGTSAVDGLGDPINGTEYGDFNLDGLINTTDLTILATNFGPNFEWALGNANGNSDVDITNTDLTIMATYFNFTNGGVDNIPEPMTMSLLALGASGLLAHRSKTRRK